MREAQIEMRSPDGTWTPVGGVCEAEPRGSFAEDGSDGRQVYVFGFDPEADQAPGVWRSVGGFDAATTAVRQLVGVRLERLADLTTGPWEREVWLPKGRTTVRVRLCDRDLT